MRIGDALERLLSPQESGEDGESGGVDAGAAFHAEMEAAIARERARRTPRADDHAAIVLDPRLVLSLQKPQETAMPADSIGTRDARDARNAPRDSSAIDAAQQSTRSREVEPSEGEARGDTEVVESKQDPTGADAATDSDAATPHHTDDAATEPDASANESTSTPARQAGDAAEGGLERAALTALSAQRNAESVAASSDGDAGVAPETEPIGGLVQKVAALASADAALTLGARPAQSGAAVEEPPSQSASAPGAAAIGTPSVDAQGFGAATDEERDGAGDQTVAAEGVAAADAALRGAASTPGSASFATTLLDATRTGGAGARQHAAATFAQDAAASLRVAAPVDRDAVLSLLSERLAGALRTGQREVIVRLSPPDLGALRVRFSIDEQRVSARVEVSDPAVHRALESGVADLRGALLKQDVELRSLTFAAAEHDGQEGGRSRSDTRDGDDHRAPEARSVIATTSPAIRRGRNRSTGLDITA